MAGATALTGLTLTGDLFANSANAFAEFENCGQGLREGGDVKLRGVLVGRIGPISRKDATGHCRVALKLFPEEVKQVPSNSGAQIRAKTVFGEKWVEILYPEAPQGTIAAGDVIPLDRTIDPLEVETILNTA